MQLEVIIPSEGGPLDEDAVIYRLGGDEAEWVPYPHQAMMNRFVNNRPRSTGVIPFDLRWISANGRGAIFTVPPTRQMITFTNAKQWVAEQGNHRVHTLFLNVPTTIMGVAMDKNFTPVQIWAYILINGALEDIYNQFCMLPLPNVYNDGHICLPASFRRLDQHGFADGLTGAYEALWDTRYNTDLLDAQKTFPGTGRPRLLWQPVVEAYRSRARSPMRRAHGVPKGTPLQMMRQWQRLSMEEVLSITDWPGASMSFAALREAVENYCPQVPVDFYRTCRESVGRL